MRRALIALAIAAAAVPMLAGVMALPRPGDPAAPVHARVAAHVVAHGAKETGAENLVTAVLLAYKTSNSSILSCRARVKPARLSVI